MNHYRVLGVPLTATQAQIKTAFRELAMKLHPDRLSPELASKTKSVDAFRQVAFAYEILGSPVRRKEYDLTFGTSRGSGSQHSSPPMYSYDGVRGPRGPRVQTEYRPGGRAHRRHGNASSQNMHVKEEHFNMKEWEAFHYGDDGGGGKGNGTDAAAAGGARVSSSAHASPGVGPMDGRANADSTDGGRSGTRWQNMPGNKDQEYFRRRAAIRRLEEDRDSDGGAARAAAAYAAQQVNMKKSTNDAMNNLNNARERRRQGEPLSTAAECCIS